MTHASSTPPPRRSFFEETMYLLLEQLPPVDHPMRSRVLRSISEGARLEYAWCYRVLTGDTPDPGIVRLQRLHDYLVRLPPGQKKWPEVPRPIEQHA